MIDTLLKVIDYFLENADCDVCGQCAYYDDLFGPNEEIMPCERHKSCGNTACREGLLKNFSDN